MCCRMLSSVHFRGTFRVRFKLPCGDVSPGHLELTLRDNGVGVPEGYDWRKSRSLGFQIVHVLAKQPQGKIKITRDDETIYLLTFALGSAA